MGKKVAENEELQRVRGRYFGARATSDFDFRVILNPLAIGVRMTPRIIRIVCEQ